ncbi:MAG: hypothetical protein ABI665_16945 [Vicinamibacterales bacterium]
MRWKGPVAGTLIVLAAVVGSQLLEPVPVYSHTPITTTIVFQKEIARIFQKKCYQCHTEGNLAMALTTYKEARPWAVAIKEEILERRMPPWSAVSGYGHFSNDNSLTGREVSLILSWADGGAPSGVLLKDEDTPPVIVPSLNAWEQGAPDAAVKVGTGHKVDAGAKDYTQRFEVTTDFATAKWLRALQLKPADRRVVRYAAIYQSGNGQWIGTWTPGLQVNRLPSGVGLQLPAHAKLTVEIGYRGTDDAAPGDGELGFYFAEKRPAQAVAPIEVAVAPAAVAPGKTGARMRGEITLKAATTTAALWPMLGAGGKSLELTAILPDGEVEPMLWLKYFRPDWPSPYVLKEPITLPAGTRLIVTAYYDNAGTTALQAKPTVAVTAWSPSRPSATPAR